MKSLKIYLIAGGVFLLLYIIAEANRPRVINWAETLSSKEKTPFAAYILFNRLHDIFPGAKITPYRQAVYNVIAEDSIANSSYVIVAPYVNLSNDDYDQLTKYVKAGNDVFIASEGFGATITKALGIETKEYYDLMNRRYGVHFVNPHLDSSKYFTLDKRIGRVFFSGLDTSRVVVLGQNSGGKANFIKVKFGKGTLYLLCNPLFFSNYSLLDTIGQKYAATALSYVKNTKQLLWDEYYSQGDEENDSPMRLFLSNQALQWAYYIAIFSLLAFVVFEIKRRQRIIPVAEPLTNSTVDFVNVVGQVYYEKKHNANIVHKKITYFLSFLRDEYQLKTANLDKDFIETLAQKTAIDVTFIAELVGYINYLTVQQKVSNTELIELNRLIEQFYIKSR